MLNGRIPSVIYMFRAMVLSIETIAEKETVKNLVKLFNSFSFSEIKFRARELGNCVQTNASSAHMSKFTCMKEVLFLDLGYLDF